MRISVLMAVTGLAGAAVLVGHLKAGEDICSPPPGTGPDVMVAHLMGIFNFGTVGDITGYALGTTSCNIGDQTLAWDAETNNHPVIGQNLYRLRAGRFEQIGMSWVKHGYSAVSGDFCCTCQDPGSVQLLGIGCSDPYASPINGDQDGLECGINGKLTCGGLGPRSEVDASTGVFAFPYGSAGQSGDAIYKRLQVHMADLDPAFNGGARYYGEGHYVTRDDTAWGNHHNNASHREVLVENPTEDGWTLNFTGETTPMLPAIHAWQANDPLVAIEVVDDQSNGRFHLGYRVTDNLNGTWHYEYALYNLNSDRSAGAFSVPVPPGVTVSNVGFHDVDYHSGEPYSSDDWAVTVGAGAVAWATDPYDAKNDVANALRWSTLYNFRFDADAPPTFAEAVIGLHKTGPLPAVAVPTLAPAGDLCPWDIDDDDLVGITDLLAVLGAWGGNPGGPPDFDGDGTVGITDLLQVLGRWGPCPLFVNCGATQAGSCFEANGTPGCLTLGCCETVCAVAPQCCELAWDDTCKEMANQLCGNCGDAGAGDCCQANGTPGCDDAGCCRAVCEVDAFCCGTAWDNMCAAEAQRLCVCP